MSAEWPVLILTGGIIAAALGAFTGYTVRAALRGDQEAQLFLVAVAVALVIVGFVWSLNVVVSR